MGLAENLARRKRTSPELARDLVAMHERGYKAAEIAKKVGLDICYVRGLIKLMEKGEERLLVAVEQRRIPISVAVAIAETEDKEVQRLLTELYETNQLRGAALLAAKRLITSRQNSSKRIFQGGKRRRSGHSKTTIDNSGKAAEKVTSGELIRAFKVESDRQQTVIERARVCETRLRFIVTAMKKLLTDEGVVNLLRAEKLAEMPQFLADHVSGKGGQLGS